MQSQKLFLKIIHQIRIQLLQKSRKKCYSYFQVSFPSKYTFQILQFGGGGGGGCWVIWKCQLCKTNKYLALPSASNLFSKYFLCLYYSHKANMPYFYQTKSVSFIWLFENFSSTHSIKPNCYFMINCYNYMTQKK